MVQALRSYQRGLGPGLVLRTFFCGVLNRPWNPRGPEPQIKSRVGLREQLGKPPCGKFSRSFRLLGLCCCHVVGLREAGHHAGSSRNSPSSSKGCGPIFVREGPRHCWEIVGTSHSAGASCRAVAFLSFKALCSEGRGPRLRELLESRAFLRRDLRFLRIVLLFRAVVDDCRPVAWIPRCRLREAFIRAQQHAVS